MKKFNLKVLLLLSFGHMVVDIYQGALPALLPFLKEKLSLTYTMAGVVLVMSNFASSILQPLFGFYSDKKEKGILLPIGLLCAGTGLALLAFPDSYILVLALTTLSGLGIAAYHPEGYKTAHFFTGERSATGMSIFSVGGNLGLSIGPVCVVYIIRYLGLSSLPVIILPALLMTVVILFARKTVAIPKMEHADKQAAAANAPKGAMFSLIMIIGIVVARTWTQMGLVSYIPFYYITYLKGDPLFAGKLVFTFLVCGALGTLIGSPIADRIGLRAFLRLTMFLATLVLPLMFVPFINQSQLLFRGPRGSGGAPCLHVLRYRGNGPETAPPQARRSLRPHGGFRHRHRGHRGDAPRGHCGQLRCAPRTGVHYGSALHRVYFEPHLKI